MDVDCILMKNIQCLLDTDCFFVSNNRGNKDIFNGFLGTYKHNPIFLEIINYMLTTQDNDYFFNCKELYNIVNKYITIQHNIYDYTFNEKKRSQIC
jgi:hypothetical protein